MIFANKSRCVANVGPTDPITIEVNVSMAGQDRVRDILRTEVDL